MVWVRPASLTALTQIWARPMVEGASPDLGEAKWGLQPSRATSKDFATLVQWLTSSSDPCRPLVKKQKKK